MADQSKLIMKACLKRRNGKARKLQNSLLRWYQGNHRVLPWRSNPTPYRVWVSEIMLQQTQVKTVIPYFNRFMVRFPDIAALAEAPEQEVMALWSGLGYYSRARNLQHSARQILERFSGKFPQKFEDILALPGIGRYTAGAICSIAFNQQQPIVDGNIRRVLTRVNALRVRIPESFFWDQMKLWIPAQDVSTFNQAMMELGALVCLPSDPHCPKCPLLHVCLAKRLGLQNSIPSARKKQITQNIKIAALVLEQKGKFLITPLEKGDFIPGDWGLPYLKIMPGMAPEEVASVLCRKVLGRTIPLVSCTRVHHTISHYRISAYGFCSPAFRGCKPIEKARWTSSTGKLLVSSLFRKIIVNYRKTAATQEES
jgi:A/G-specific adenine glycosylase